MERIDKTVTISIPAKMLNDLDYVRGMVSRSKWIQKLIERNLELMQLTNE